MRYIGVNQMFGLQLMTIFLLIQANTVSPHIHTEGNILDDDFFEVSLGDVCPNAEDIKPCRCSHSNQAYISMECSDIENEEDLKEVFSKDFPIKDLYQLQIICKGNNSINALKSGDFGSVSFENIVIAYCGLSVIEEAALEGSYGTLELLSLQENQLTSIPDLSKFEALKYLCLVDNVIEAFPIISSNTLFDVNLSGNNFSTIPREAISQMPALSQLYLYDLNLTDIPLGSFAGKENLSSLDLSYNLLEVWSHDIIRLRGDDTHLWLSNNQIAEIKPGSFAGVTTSLDLRHNALKELHEHVFKSLLETHVDVMLDGNPLGCGCDIKWLILNATLLEQFYVVPRCADGTSFLDLDPTYYEENC